MDYLKLYLIIGCFWSVISEVFIRMIMRIEYGPSVMDFILAILFWPIQLLAYIFNYENIR